MDIRTAYLVSSLLSDRTDKQVVRAVVVLHLIFFLLTRRRHYDYNKLSFSTSTFLWLFILNSFTNKYLIYIRRLN